MSGHDCVLDPFLSGNTLDPLRLLDVGKDGGIAVIETSKSFHTILIPWLCVCVWFSRMVCILYHIPTAMENSRNQPLKTERQTKFSIQTHIFLCEWTLTDLFGVFRNHIARLIEDGILGTSGMSHFSWMRMKERVRCLTEILWCSQLGAEPRQASGSPVCMAPCGLIGQVSKISSKSNRGELSSGIVGKEIFVFSQATRKLA